MIPLTGPVTGTMLRAEYGLGNGPVASMNAIAAMRRAAGVAPGAPFKISDLRGSHTIRTTTLNASIFALMGNPSVASSRYRLVIEPGIGVGSNNPTQFAADSGQFPAGSTLTIDIYGGLEGAGGLYGVQAGRGGGALYAPYLNQTVIVNPKPGSALLAGGGAGGKGGDGGTGGQGGPDGTQGPRYDTNNRVSFVGSEGFTFTWDGAYVADSSTGTVDAGGYHYSTYGAAVTSSGGIDKFGNDTRRATYQITKTGSGPGGAGGGAGVGGVGGRGQGYDGASGSGTAGTGGGAGVNPGTGAGAGGNGGGGGRGGDGGGWGADGAASTAGTNGSPGAAGFGGAGQPGGAAQGAFAGGPRGYYVYRNTANVTVNAAGGQILGAIG